MKLIAHSSGALQVEPSQGPRWGHRQIQCLVRVFSLLQDGTVLLGPHVAEGAQGSFLMTAKVRCRRGLSSGSPVSPDRPQRTARRFIVVSSKAKGAGLCEGAPEPGGGMSRLLWAFEVTTVARDV